MFFEHGISYWGPILLAVGLLFCVAIGVMLYGDNGEHPASPYEAQWMFGFVLVVLGFLSFIVVNYRSSGDGRQPSIWIATFLSAPIILMGVWNFLGATIKPNWWLTNKVSTNVGISMFVYWAVMFFVVL